MNKAIFLDRDGVINSDEGHYYVYKLEDFKINDGLVDCLKKFIKNNYLLFIISNQGGIAKGIYTKDDVEIIHNHLISILNKEGITITDIYYCPHHSDIEKCICRKPDSLFIEKAIAKYDIDISKSFLIGDNNRDIAAAEKAGLIPIKVDSNENLTNHCEFILNYFNNKQ